MIGGTRLALLSIFIVCVTADVDCEVGAHWVRNFIQYECYSTDTVIKGARPMACAPTNNNNGVKILPGEIYNEEHFRYQCNYDGETMSYEIVNCFDKNGELMDIGETRDMLDYSTVSCYQDGAETKKKVEKELGVHADRHILATGCKVNGKIYTSGQTWNALFSASSTVQTGMVMRCVGNAKNGFAIQRFGCVGTDNKAVLEKKYNTIGGEVVQCVKNALGDYELVVVEENRKPVLQY